MINESIGLATRDRTVQHIAQATSAALENNYGIKDGEVVDDILRIIGMHPDMFDALRMDSVIISERLNDVSIDGNANKSEKTIAGIDQETAAPSNKVKGHDALYREMVELFGHAEAQRLTGEMYTLSLGISDSTKLRTPYCFSIDASKLIYEGRPFGQLPSLPVQNLRGYVSCLTETIHQLSSHLAGAIAVGSFFLDIGHMCMYKHGYTLSQLRNNKKIRKEITNSFQHFVHSVNMLSRNSVECFTPEVEVLTINGFKKYNEINTGDMVYTWNNGNMEIQPIKHVNIKNYNGEIHCYSGRDLSFNVTPNHRIIRKKHNSKEYEVVYSRDTINHKTPMTVPVSFIDNKTYDYPISDEMLALLTIVLTDGCISGEKVSIFKSENRFGNDYIEQTLNSLGAEYSKNTRSNVFGKTDDKFKNKEYSTNTYNIKGEIKKKIIELLSGNKKNIPSFFTNLSRRQAKIVIDIWSKFDGYGDINKTGEKVKLQVDNYEIGNQLQQVAVLAGFGSTISERKIGHNETSTIYVYIRKRINKDVNKKQIKQYSGIVWCPTVDNGILLFRDGNKNTFISGNSPFTNISVNDKIKLNKMLDEMGHMFPVEDIKLSLWQKAKMKLNKQTKEDFCRQYIIDYIYELQNIYLDFFDKGAPSLNGAPYRFPVTTLCLSKHRGRNDKWGISDDESLDNFCSREIYRYNIFASEGSKFASCCFDENEKAIFRSTQGVKVCSFKEFFSIKREEANNPKIFHNGSWRSFSRVVAPYGKKYYKITTENNKKIIVTEDHLNPSLRGDVRSDELTTNDYLMFNTMSLDPVPESDHNLTYEQGYLIGAFLGDGSFGSAKDVNGFPYQTCLSLNKECYEEIKANIDMAMRQIGSCHTLQLSSPVGKLYPCTLSGASAFIKEWCTKEDASRARLNMDVLLQSKAFRIGIIDGWYATDGGNSNRSYTVSEQFVSDMEAVCTSLGIITVIDSVDRTDEKVIIDGKEYTRNYPLFCLRRYDSGNKTRMKGVYKKKNNSIFFKIRSIELVDGSPNAYCVQTDSKYEEPYFTLPNGIITHNCRLINDEELMNDYASQSNSFGAGGAISLGSHRVVTINLPRIALEANSEYDFFNILSQRIHDSAKILKAHKQLIKNLTDAGLHMFISNGWLRLDRMFSTFGIIGTYECAEIIRQRFGNGRDVEGLVLEFLNKEVRDVSKELGIAGNIEQIPGESFAGRFADADRLIFGEEPFEKYGLGPIYSNQLIPLWHDADIWERLTIDGKYNGLITGGGIVHATIGTKVTGKQAKKIILYAVMCGCEHFALNSIYSECEDGHITFGKNEVCPLCKKNVVDYLTRVVGFFVRVSDFSKIRREWEFPRRTVITSLSEK